MNKDTAFFFLFAILAFRCSSHSSYHCFLSSLFYRHCFFSSLCSLSYFVDVPASLLCRCARLLFLIAILASLSSCCFSLLSPYGYLYFFLIVVLVTYFRHHFLVAFFVRCCSRCLTILLLFTLVINSLCLLLSLFTSLRYFSLFPFNNCKVEWGAFKAIWHRRATSLARKEYVSIKKPWALLHFFSKVRHYTKNYCDHAQCLESISRWCGCSTIWVQQK